MGVSRKPPPPLSHPSEVVVGRGGGKGKRKKGPAKKPIAKSVVSPEDFESQKAAAFAKYLDYYAKFGQTSCGRVAQDLGISVFRVERWCSREGWKDQIKALEAGAQAEFATNLKDQLKGMKLRLWQMGRLAVDSAEKQIKSGRLKVRTMGDLRMLQDFLMSLAGEAIQGPMVQVNVDSRQLPTALQDQLRKVADQLLDAEQGNLPAPVPMIEVFPPLEGEPPIEAKEVPHDGGSCH